MPVTRIQLENFTAFRNLELELSPGLNIFIGANATGKTHVLKAAYAACKAQETGTGETDSFIAVLTQCFFPNAKLDSALVHRHVARSEHLLIDISTDSRRAEARVHGPDSDVNIGESSVRGPPPASCAFIPAKEILSNAPGFLSLYSTHEISFDSTYPDILIQAYRPPLRDHLIESKRGLLRTIETAIYGMPVIRGEKFCLKSNDGEIEFDLLAEGFRKLALLWLLIQNGAITEGSVLLWDEPEANLNPGLIGTVIDILLQLQRMGTQVILATHHYAILKEIDLRREKEDCVRFHSLFRKEDAGDICCISTEDYLKISPNSISDAARNLYDRDVMRALRSGEAV